MAYVPKKKKEVIEPELGFRNFVFNKPVEAWESINEMFLRHDPKLVSNVPGMNGILTNTAFAYNVSIFIKKPKFDPEFDFGNHFYYSKSKWSGLITNYIDLDLLDEFRDYIREIEKDMVKSRYYTQGFHFSDAHGHGKGCILSGIFSRQLGYEKPLLTVYIRSSEVTTRLPLDLLFFQRLGTYVYGHNDFTLNVIIKQMYSDDAITIMYHKHKDLNEVLKDAPEERKEKVLKLLDNVLTGDEEKFASYGTSLRVFRVLRSGESDKEKPKSLLAKDCIIGDWEGIPLPKPCPSAVERDRLKNIFVKFSKKYGFDLKKMKFTTKKEKKKKILSVSKSSKGEEEDV